MGPVDLWRIFELVTQHLWFSSTIQHDHQKYGTHVDVDVDVGVGSSEGAAEPVCVRACVYRKGKGKGEEIGQSALIVCATLAGMER